MPSVVHLELVGKEKIGVKFDYNASLVAAIKRLQHRAWNPANKRWDVHVAHLDDIIGIFGIDRAGVPAEILSAYENKYSGPRKLHVRLGILHGKLEGIGAPIGAIDEETSFYLPGYKFSDKFKQGRWDGKRHLFERKSQRFPAGLWPRIQAVLDKHRIDYELHAEKVKSGSKLKFGDALAELRDYQKKTVTEAAKRGRGIIQIATGGGKTVVAAHLIRRLARPTFFFVHTRELLYQARGVFERELGVEIGQLGDGVIELRDVTVATLQTSARAFGFTVPRESDESDERGEERQTAIEARADEIKNAIENAGVVIFDECHHVPADTAYRLAFRTKAAAFRYGLSATPWRDDRHDLLLEAALGEPVCSITSTDLIQRQFLVRPHITMESAPPPRFVGRRPPYAEIYRAAIVENLARNRVIAARASEMAAQGLSVLILVAQVEHGRLLQNLLPEARFAYGSLETELRRQYIAELEQKLRPVLIATTLADEGLDVPTLGAVILAGGGKSATKAYQRIGRALRPAPGKEKALVIDFFDRVPYLDEHSMARLDLYRHEPAFEIETQGFGK